jgi:hypothetical protein
MSHRRLDPSSSNWLWRERTSKTIAITIRSSPDLLPQDALVLLAESSIKEIDLQMRALYS